MPNVDAKSDLAARLAALEARLASVEKRQATMERTPVLDLEALMEKVLGPDAVGHMKAARREDLLTMRALLDTWIERLERVGDKAGSKASKPPPRRRESISIE